MYVAGGRGEEQSGMLEGERTKPVTYLAHGSNSEKKCIVWLSS